MLLYMPWCSAMQCYTCHTAVPCNVICHCSVMCNVTCQAVLWHWTLAMFKLFLPLMWISFTVRNILQSKTLYHFLHGAVGKGLINIMKATLTNEWGDVDWWRLQRPSLSTDCCRVTCNEGQLRTRSPLPTRNDDHTHSRFRWRSGWNTV